MATIIHGTAVKFRLNGTSQVEKQVFMDGDVQHADAAQAFVDSLREHGFAQMEKRIGAFGREIEVPVWIITQAAKVDFFVAYPITRMV